MIEKRFRKKQSINKVGRQKLIESIKTYFSEEDNVIFAYIHGSFTEEKTFRDIDVALYLKNSKEELGFESDYSYELTKNTGYPVEVIVINRAPVPVQMSVLRKGILIVNKSEDIRTDFIECVGRRYRQYSHFRNIALETVK
jgi:predicted nucleotidyltransferase